MASSSRISSLKSPNESVNPGSTFLGSGQAVVRDVNSPYFGLHVDMVNFMMRNNIEMDKGSTMRSASVHEMMLKNNDRDSPMKVESKPNRATPKSTMKSKCDKRKGLIIFGIVAAILVVIVVVIVLAVLLTRDSPLPENEWWEGGLIYSINVPKFYSLDGVTSSRLDHVKAQVPYIADKMNPTIVSLSHFIDTDTNGAINDFKNIDPNSGSISMFKSIMQDFSDRNIRTFVELTLHITSTSHPWFLESRKASSGAMDDIYVWNSQAGSSNFKWSWVKDSLKNFYYLSRNGVLSSAILNFKSNWVQNQMKEVIQYWIDAGVNGFIISDSITIPDDQLDLIGALLKGYQSESFRYFADDTGVNEKLQNTDYCSFTLKTVTSFESEITKYPQQTLDALSKSNSKCTPVWRFADVSINPSPFPLYAMGMFLPGFVLIKAGQEVEYEVTANGPTLIWKDDNDFQNFPENPTSPLSKSLPVVKIFSSLTSIRSTNKMMHLTRDQSPPQEISRQQNTLIMKKSFGSRQLYFVVSFNKLNTDIRIQDYIGMDKGSIVFDSFFRYSDKLSLNSVLMSNHQVLLIEN